ncbi:MAG: thioredoxin family protein [Bacteroidetes bacterium]|jgi:hypothetical protein|nr:thioredoxin family protein [Bacteroidota bacterium]
MLVFLYVLLLVSNVTVAQQDVVFVFTADRPDSIYVSFNREPVFNESLMGDAFRTIQLKHNPVVIRFKNVTKLSRLSLTSYGWPGNFIATNWIVEPEDSIHIHIDFSQKPEPAMKFYGRGSPKYQLAFETRKLNEQIIATEFEVYDNVKSHNQAYHDAGSLEWQYLNKVKTNKKLLSPQVYQTWLADIQATADLARLHIRSHQWTSDQKMRPAIRKELLKAPLKMDVSLGSTSRALLQYHYELLKWKVLQEHDPEYQYYELSYTLKITLDDLFLEFQKQPTTNQQFLMVYSLVNLHTLQQNFGETHPDILQKCLGIAEQTVTGTDLKQRLKETSQHIRPGTIVKNLVTLTEVGDTLTLSMLRGKKVLLDRWIADCTGCLDFKKEVIEQLLPKIKERDDIVIWSVGSVKDFDFWKKLLPTNSHPDFVSVWLDKQSNSNDWETFYNISYAPFIMLIDEEGKLISSTVRNIGTIIELLKIAK